MWGGGGVGMCVCVGGVGVCVGCVGVCVWVGVWGVCVCVFVGGCVEGAKCVSEGVKIQKMPKWTIFDIFSSKGVSASDRGMQMPPHGLFHAATDYLK